MVHKCYPIRVGGVDENFTPGSTRKPVTVQAGSLHSQNGRRKHATFVSSRFLAFKEEKTQGVLRISCRNGRQKESQAGKEDARGLHLPNDPGK